MIYDCPSCTAALRFDPTLNKLECLSCGNKYELSEFENKDTLDVINTITTENNGETMECNIYSCTACGAELAVNGVKSSTFCAYCGQPTIVFSRVSHALKPKYIIPLTLFLLKLLISPVFMQIVLILQKKIWITDPLSVLESYLIKKWQRRFT